MRKSVKLGLLLAAVALVLAGCEGLLDNVPSGNESIDLNYIADNL